MSTYIGVPEDMSIGGEYVPRCPWGTEYQWRVCTLVYLGRRVLVESTYLGVPREISIGGEYVPSCTWGHQYRWRVRTLVYPRRRVWVERRTLVYLETG